MRLVLVQERARARLGARAGRVLSEAEEAHLAGVLRAVGAATRGDRDAHGEAEKAGEEGRPGPRGWGAGRC
eukprot:1184673-Prorocentrum_minimum.AAC.2